MVEYYKELKKLKISTPKLDNIVEIALKNKALGVKPTGGWGGGCCLVLFDNKDKALKLINTFKDYGFSSFLSKSGVEGTKIIIH